MQRITRRELYDAFFRAVLPLYGEREARSVAYAAMEGLCGVSRTGLATEPSVELEFTPALELALRELGEGRPVQYVVGRTEFCGLDFRVDERALIPRPETEELVAWVLEAAGRRAAPSILDIGTGSGAIAVALAAGLPAAAVTALDVSPGALELAAANACANGVEVAFLLTDILSPDPGVLAGRRFDVIVSNPPYIPESDRGSMHRNVTAYEPGGALFVPDDDPFVFYRAIARKGRGLLAEGGALFFEIYERASAEMAALLAGEGYGDVERREDMNGRARMVKCLKR